jgi:hypothetical protein
MAILRKAVIAFLALACASAEEPIALREATFEPGFEAVLRAEPLLVNEGGAKLIQRKGVRYFLAVGVTSVGEGTAVERLRQLRVGRINALRAAAEFISPVEVNAETSLRETTSIRNTDGVKSFETRKVLDESTRTKLEAILRAPVPVGSWKSADGKLFFYALGSKLP